MRIPIFFQRRTPMKRTLLWITALLMIVMSIVGCESNQPTPQTTTEQVSGGVTTFDKTEPATSTPESQTTQATTTESPTTEPTLPASEGLEFTLDLDKKSYSVSGMGICTDTDVVIPTEYNDLPVTEVRHQAFEYCTNLRSIIIPDSIIRINQRAFYGCASLTTVMIGNGVTSIDDSAFRDCTNLKYNRYDNAYYLGNNNNPYFFLIKATSESVMSCKINENTKYIAEGAFSDCYNLTRITIPNGVTSIGKKAFFSCDDLTNITIGNCVTSIGRHAFDNCRSLTCITLPNGVTSIGSYAFSDCKSLTSVTFENTSGWQVSVLGFEYATVTVTDSSANAEYLTSTYCDYEWTRN